MKAEELAREIDRGDIRPLYCLYGEESYLLERGVKGLVSRLVAPDMRDFNLNVFHGNECPAGEIVAAAQTLPMFAQWRVVVVKECDRLSAPAMEELSAYAQDPSPSTCLIITGEKVDQRKRLFAEIKRQGGVVEFKRLYENQLLPFVRGEAAGLGKRFQPAAAELLVYLSGNSLRELVSQVEKISLYAGDRETIQITDVREVVSDSKVDTVFELANSLGEKDLGKALRGLNTLLHDGEAPLLILAMIARHFRQLWRVRELQERKTPPAEMAKAAGVHPYFLQGIQRQARNYGKGELAAAFDRFFQVDLALKSGGGRPAVLMERLVMEVCGKA